MDPGLSLREIRGWEIETQFMTEALALHRVVKRYGDKRAVDAKHRWQTNL